MKVLLADYREDSKFYRENKEMSRRNNGARREMLELLGHPLELILYPCSKNQGISPQSHLPVMP
jgi:hypothetical protein